MTNRFALILVAAGALGWAGATSPTPAGAQVRTARVLVLERAEDGFYDPVRLSDGLVRTQNHRPFPGAELGARDSAALGRAANLEFEVERRSLSPEADIAAEIDRAASDGAAAVLLDLPAADMAAAAQAPAAERLPLFNIRDTNDALRRDVCSAGLFHVIPGQAALTDALAQFVVRRNWRRVLVLVGPEEADRTLARTFDRSAKKFGAKIVETKPFVAGNDPRNREQTNVALMTSDSDFDVVFLADTVQDFGRYVPYRLARPRPVIGTEGLRAAAWSPASERYGAPQVNSRFTRAAGRPMSELDWSAWVAVRALAEAMGRAGARSGPEIIRALSEGNLTIEMSKGVTGSFRSWDHQLRQPIMLHTANAVVEFAPLEGFLHERSTLDTLGVGETETRCKRP